MSDEIRGEFTRLGAPDESAGSVPPISTSSVDGKALAS